MYGFVVSKRDQLSFCRVIDKNSIENLSLWSCENSIIELIDFKYNEILIPIKISNCIIKKLDIYGCWFKKGFILEKCIIIDTIIYEMGGHNNMEIQLTNNIFCKFIDFFDCHFIEKVIIENNIFMEGTNIIGNQNKGYKNTFEKDPSGRGGRAQPRRGEEHRPDRKREKTTDRKSVV